MKYTLPLVSLLLTFSGAAQESQALPSVESSNLIDYTTEENGFITLKKRKSTYYISFDTSRKEGPQTIIEEGKPQAIREWDNRTFVVFPDHLSEITFNEYQLNLTKVDQSTANMVMGSRVISINADHELIQTDNSQNVLNFMNLSNGSISTVYADQIWPGMKNRGYSVQTTAAPKRIYSNTCRRRVQHPDGTVSYESGSIIDVTDNGRYIMDRQRACGPAKTNRYISPSTTTKTYTSPSLRDIQCFKQNDKIIAVNRTIYSYGVLDQNGNQLTRASLNLPEGEASGNRRLEKILYDKQTEQLYILARIERKNLTLFRLNTETSELTEVIKIPKTESTKSLKVYNNRLYYRKVENNYNRLFSLPIQ